MNIILGRGWVWKMFILSFKNDLFLRVKLNRKQKLKLLLSNIVHPPHPKFLRLFYLFISLIRSTIALSFNFLRLFFPFLSLLRSTIAIPDIWWSTQRAFPLPIVLARTPNDSSSFLFDLYPRLGKWQFWRTDQTKVVRTNFFRTKVVHSSTTTKEGVCRGLGRNRRPTWPCRRRRSTWGGRGKSSRTAIRSESGEKKLELVLQILKFYSLIFWSYRSFFTDSTGLCTDSTVLFPDPTRLFIISTAIFTDTKVELTDSTALFTDSTFLFTGSTALFTDSTVVFDGCTVLHRYKDCSRLSFSY